MKKNSIHKQVYRLSLAATIFMATPTQGDTPAFSSGGGLAIQPPSFDGSRGWQFSLGSDTAITQLGVFDSGGDGLMNAHQIGLWGLDGTLLASATVPAGTGASLIDGYRYVSISPVTFGPFVQGIVAAQFSAGDADDQITPRRGLFNGSVLAFDGRYGLGSDLPFPSLGTPNPEGSFGPRFWEANFQYGAIPEPSVKLLLLPGLFYLLFQHRKRIAQRERIRRDQETSVVEVN